MAALIILSRKFKVHVIPACYSGQEQLRELRIDKLTVEKLHAPRGYKAELQGFALVSELEFSERAVFRNVVGAVHCQL